MRREKLLSVFDALGLEYSVPQGSFFVLVDFRYGVLVMVVKWLYQRMSIEKRWGWYQRGKEGTGSFVIG